jgi:hypothetical protein
MNIDDDYSGSDLAVTVRGLSAAMENQGECRARAPELRSYRVSLVGYGVYAVWVTAESRRAACDLAERMWNENRSAVARQDGVIEYIEILDEYEDGGVG